MRNKNNKLYEYLLAVVFFALIVSAFLVGYGAGLSAFKYYVLVAAIIGIVAYLNVKDVETEKRRISNFFNAVIMLCIIFFVLLFVGSCLRSCTSGGGNTRQQRIEMGLSPY